MGASSFSISAPWTARSRPVDPDDWVPLEEAVSRFSPSCCAEQIAAAGAQYVIFRAGETNWLIAVRSSQFTLEHLQGHRWVCPDNPDWVRDKAMTPLVPPRYKREHVVDYVRTCNKARVPVTFNID